MIQAGKTVKIRRGAGGSVAYSTAAGLPSLPAATVLILVLSTLCLAGTALHRVRQS